MIILIGIIAIGIIILSIFVNDDDVMCGLAVTGVFILIICIIAAMFVAGGIVKLRIIDDQIAMYQEENEKIEAQMDTLVKQYQEYESGVFVNTTSESSMSLVSLYPELKTDTLVQKQMDVYLANNQNIKDLKNKKLKEPILRWWLYFGK